MFGFNSIIVLGAPRKIVVELRAKRPLAKPILVTRLVVNAPCPGFLFIDAIEWDGTNILVGRVDAFAFASFAFGVYLDVPRIDTKTRVRTVLTYTGIVPIAYKHGKHYACSIEWGEPSNVENGIQKAERVKHKKWPNYLRLVKG